MVANRVKPVPKRLGELIDLIRYLPVCDAPVSKLALNRLVDLRNAPDPFKFALLRPFIVESELELSIDLELTLKSSVSFRKWFLTSDPVQWREFHLVHRTASLTPEKLVHERLSRFALPKGLTEYLRHQDPGAWWRWRSLYESLEILNDVVTEGQELKSRRSLITFHSASARRLYVDAEGFLREAGTLFSQVVTQEDIEPGRIRKCPQCKRIFWAGRITKTACSPNCTNAWHSKQSRNRANKRGATTSSKRKSSGHSYRPKSREPRHVMKVRQALVRWPGVYKRPFKRTPAKLKDIAALADVTLKQCEEALDFIESQPRKSKKRQT